MLSSFVLAVALAPSTLGASCTATCWSGEPAVVTTAWQEVQRAALDPRHQADLDNDIKIGKKYSEQVEKEYKLSTNDEYIERVQRVSSELAAIARVTPVTVTWGDRRLNPFDYQFKVVENEDVNAFSLPGGYIYVYEGLCKFAQSDDELAGVMAHEIAHASLRHVATLQREANKLQMLTLPLILIAIFGGGDASNLGTLASLIGTAKGSGWSVSAEQAADYAGFQYILKSRYNPVGMLTFMERLAKEQRFTDRMDLGIFRTHPPSRERADTLARRLTERNIPIRRSLVSTAYRVEVREGASGAIELWFDRRRLTAFAGPNGRARSTEAAEKLNEFFDTVPDLFDVQVQGGNIVAGRRQPLFQVTEDDARALGLPPSEAPNHVSLAIKRSLYLLAYRVWDAR